MEQIILDIIEFLKQFSYFGVVLALTFEFIPQKLFCLWLDIGCTRVI